MTAFLCLATLLLLVGAGVLTRGLWPLAARRGASGLGREVEALRLQLRQLSALHAGGALTDDQFAASRQAVERRLIEALAPEADGAAAGSPARAGASPRLALALLAFLVTVTAAGYGLVGTPGTLSTGPADASAVATSAEPAGAGREAPHAVTPAQIDEMVARLQDRLKTHPEDAQGWMMLARSQVALGRHAQSIDAFAQAERLRPDDAALLADYADALAMAHDRSLAGAPTALLQRALKIDPRNDKALALAGTAAFDAKDYKGAVRYWETLAQVEPAGGPFAEQVGSGIAEARKLAGLPPAPLPAGPGLADGPLPAGPGLTEAPPPVAGGPGGATVRGTVTLAPALASRAGPDDVLFVFARAVDGPRMPVAILRKRVKDLPLDFTLDDSLAMSPSSALSSVDRVVVGARISRSGNAMAQPGDLQGLTPAVAVGAAGVHVEIDEQVATQPAPPRTATGTPR